MNLDKALKFVIIGGGIGLTIVMIYFGMKTDKSSPASVSSTEVSASFTRAGYNQINNGMSKAQVINILGSPDNTSETQSQGIGTLEMFTYVSYTTEGVLGGIVYFNSGFVSMKTWTKL